MQSHYTDKAKSALSFAEKSAKSLKQGYVGTEHILLGLLKEGTGVAARVFLLWAQIPFRLCLLCNLDKAS